MKDVWADRAWLVIVPLSATAVTLLTVRGETSPVRLALTVWFLVVCPGMPWVRLLRPGNELVALALAGALSLAVEMIVAGIAMYAGLWTPTILLALFVDIALVGTAAQYGIGRRHDPGGEPEIGPIG